MKKASGKKSENASTVSAQPAQHRFLTRMLEEHKKIEVFLMSGVKLEGEIVSFDQFVILMKGATTDMVYKHAVSTIQPATGARPRGDARSRDDRSRSPTISRRTRPRLIKPTGDGS